MAKTASRRPIETITIGFCVVTLAYFQLLHAVKHSEFLHFPSGGAQDPASISEEAGAAILARSSADGAWLELAPGHSSEAITLTLNRIVVTLDSDISQSAGTDDRNLLVYPAHSSAPVLLSELGSDGEVFEGSSAHSIVVTDKSVRKALDAFEKHLLDASAGSTHLRDICYRAPGSTECFYTNLDSTTATSPDARSAMIAIGLQPSAASQDWIQQVANSASEYQGYAFIPQTPARKRADTGLGLSFSPFPQSRGLRNASHSSANFNEEEARSVKWMLYAARAFVMRFYALARVRIMFRIV